jgi:hypothetical protein
MDKHIDTIIRAADALDSLGRRDLADALDAIVLQAGKGPKPRHKPGDKVHLSDKIPLPITAVKVHPHVGPYYQVSLWVLERDLDEPQEEATEDDTSKE